MKKLISKMRFLVLAMLIIPIISCNNDELNNVPENTQKKYEVVTIQGTKSTNGEPENILKFHTQQAFEETCSLLMELNPGKTEEWKENLDYLSMAEIYDMAMDEATELDFTEAEYKAFKAKYQKYLYFPEYKLDYGAYIPFKEMEPALLTIANENGRYMIGESIVQLERLMEYSDLQIAGVAFHEDEGYTPPPIPVPPTPIPGEKPTVYAYKLAVPGGWWWDKVRIGGNEYKYDSKWKDVGNGRMIKVNLGRSLNKRWNNIAKAVWHTEVSFRKKGFLGAYYNYKSTTEISVQIQYSNTLREIMPSLLKENLKHWEHGYSSHDGWIGCYYEQANASEYNILNEGTKKPDIGSYPTKLYFFPGYTAIMTLTYRGMTGTKTFVDTKPDLWGYETTKNKSFD